MLLGIIYQLVSMMQSATMFSPSNVNSTSAQVVAKVSNLHKSFGAQTVLQDIELAIYRQQVLAVLGANGAGKTTLINLLMGKLQPDQGDISVLALRPGCLQVKRQTGAMLQVANLPETLKIKETIRLFQRYYPKPMDYQHVIAYAGLEALQHRYIRGLSGGEKQRLLFALSICGNPRLLFLDEPSVGMDLEARQGLWRAIGHLKDQGTAVVLTTHYLPEAESLADQIVLLKQGRIVQRGTTEQFKSLMSSRMIRFSSNYPHQTFSHLPAVCAVSQSGRYSCLQSTDANQSVFALLQHYPDIEDLSVSGAGLEDVFLQLNAESPSGALN